MKVRRIPPPACPRTPKRDLSLLAPRRFAQNILFFSPLQLRHRSVTGPLQVRHSPVTGPLQVRHSPVTGPSQPRYRSVTGPSQPRYRSVTAPSQVRHRSVTGPLQVRHRSNSSSMFFCPSSAAPLEQQNQQTQPALNSKFSQVRSQIASSPRGIKMFSDSLPHFFWWEGLSIPVGGINLEHI